MNIKRIRQTALMTLILGGLALFASLTGILNKNLYADVVSAGSMPEHLIWGSIAQDIVSAPIAIALIILSVVLYKRTGYKTLISAIGLAWYLFYAFGLYVIQGQYTSIYLVYLAIWGLSIYSMIWGFISIKQDIVNQYTLPKTLKKLIIGYLMMTLLILVPGWLMKMQPDIARNVPGAAYGVYILDLCVVFPAFGITSWMLLRKIPFGNVLAGITLIKAWTLCLSWGFAQISAPYVGLPLELDMVIISSSLTIIGFILHLLYLLKMSNKPT